MMEMAVHITSKMQMPALLNFGGIYLVYKLNGITELLPRSFRAFLTDIQYYTRFISTTQWFDICIHCEMVTSISLVTIYHHANCYTIPCAIHYIPMSYIFYNWKICFVHPPTHLPSGNHRFVFYINESVSVLFGLVISFVFRFHI